MMRYYTGDAFAFMGVQDDWGRALSWPWETVVKGFQNLWPEPETIMVPALVARNLDLWCLLIVAVGIGYAGLRQARQVPDGGVDARRGADRAAAVLERRWPASTASSSPTGCSTRPTPASPSACPLWWRRAFWAVVVVALQRHDLPHGRPLRRRPLRRLTAPFGSRSGCRPPGSVSPCRSALPRRAAVGGARAARRAAVHRAGAIARRRPFAGGAGYPSGRSATARCRLPVGQAPTKGYAVARRAVVHPCGVRLPVGQLSTWGFVVPRWGADHVAACTLTVGQVFRQGGRGTPSGG